MDFAYAVHTDIGNRCVAVKINHELVPLRTELKNGDRVEIITAAHAKPNPVWLNFVVTGKARSHIRHFLKTMQYEESAQLGERLLNQALTALKSGPGPDQRATSGRGCSRKPAPSRGRNCSPTSGSASNSRSSSRASCCRSPNPKAAKAEQLPGSLIIRGSEGMAVQFAKCCHPIPGDPIIGFMQQGPGHGRSTPTTAR